VNSKKLNIALLIPTLSCGGAERVLVSMAQGFKEQGYRVSVITLGDKDNDFYVLPQGIERYALDVMGASQNWQEAILGNWNRIKAIRAVVKHIEPDVVISFLRITNVTTILALLGSGVPLVVTEHNDSQTFSYGLLWETLRKLTYPFCAQVVSVSKGVENALGISSSSKKSVIYNPIIIPDLEDEPELPFAFDSNKKYLVSMGRLTHQKGFDLLLKSFQKVAHKNSDWQLLILGDGALKSELQSMSAELGLKDRVIFTGSLRNPFQVLRKSQFFVMASRNEGFPMAHGEALGCGLPVIATDCPSGPSEMIRHNVDGILVPNGDVDALSLAIEQLIDNESQRKELASRAKEVTERFGLDSIINDWNVLIHKLI